MTLIDAKRLEKYRKHGGLTAYGYNRALGGLKTENPEQMLQVFKKTIDSFQKSLWTNLMRIEWLDRHISYNGKVKNETQRYGKNGAYPSPFSFGINDFYHQHFSFSRRLFYSEFFKSFTNYADDFYPDFDKLDGLTYEFPYPYVFMNMECLFLVHQLKQRLELLAIGEKGKMSLRDFTDMVYAYGSDAYYNGDQAMHMYVVRWENVPKYVKLFPSNKI